MFSWLPKEADTNRMVRCLSWFTYAPQFTCVCFSGSPFSSGEETQLCCNAFSEIEMLQRLDPQHITRTQDSHAGHVMDYLLMRTRRP